jgi:hypothetical protein
MSQTDDYLDVYVAAGLSGAGARPEEIAELESLLGRSLPAAYRAWLLLVGRLPPSQLIGSHCEFHRLRELQTWAAELLHENGDAYRLPEYSFVFLMHQGYYFAYFALDGSDDPPVFSWQEGQDAALTMAAERFSMWATGVVAETPTIEEQRHTLRRMGEMAGWADPEMDVYDQTCAQPYDDSEWTSDETANTAERMFDDLDSAERIP